MYVLWAWAMSIEGQKRRQTKSHIVEQPSVKIWNFNDMRWWHNVCRLCILDICCCHHYLSEYQIRISTYTNDEHPTFQPCFQPFDVSCVVCVTVEYHCSGGGQLSMTVSLSPVVLCYSHFPPNWPLNSEQPNAAVLRLVVERNRCLLIH